MSDRIEKLYDRWSQGESGNNEDRVHEAIDRLLWQARLIHGEDWASAATSDENDDVIHEMRVAILDTLADLAGIEPTYTGPWHIVQYTVTREFGGHEEGGWWYDWHSNPVLVGTIQEDHDLAYRTCRILNEQEKERRKEEGRPQGRYSVHGGEDIVCVVEETVGENESTEVPHYE